MGETEETDQVLNSTKNSNEINGSIDTSTSRTIYYGVYIPADVLKHEDDTGINVFDKKSEALKLVKKYKKARFKAFDSYGDAVEFATNGYDYSSNHSLLESSKYGQDNPSVGEKHSPFRGPTFQNLVKLRKAIEAGDVETVQTTIWENPRYLIGSGDTPSILQEGFRYNALHTAAKAKNPVMCDLILNTISNVNFIKKLYVDDNNPEDRAKILLDLYLNTPDKGLHETPLHFAVKFGAPKCVEVLVSFPQCDKNLRNKHGKLPIDIICDRYDGPDASTFSTEIAGYLQDNYYVPVLRTEGNCAPPIIGEPFSPSSPPNFNRDPLSPRMEIHAYAGPMNKEGAEKFRKIWKTPPRVLNFGNSHKGATGVAALRMKDHEKGLERLGDNLAKKMDVAWKEYWPFLDSFIDLASKEGLAMFEKFLGGKLAAQYDAVTPPPLNCSLVGQTSSPKAGIGKGEHNHSHNRLENSPMWELCKALQACTINDHSPKGITQQQSTGNAITATSPEGGLLLNGANSSENAPVPNPHVCIDKALHVFAKRISNDIIYLHETEYDTCELVEAQAKQLQLLMSSYISDPRFNGVDFSVVHDRLAYLARQLLGTYMQDVSPSSILKRLDRWLDIAGAHHDGFSSDDEAAHAAVRSVKNEHSLCLLQAIRTHLGGDSCFAEVTTESECISVWKQMQNCQCTWDVKPMKRNGSKRLHLRHKLAPLVLQKCVQSNSQHDLSGILNMSDRSEGESCDEADDEFYTPPGTPSLLTCSFEINDEDEANEDDIFHETQLPDADIFIEGDIPTKMDYAAFNALKYAECDLNPNDYPNIYRWQHTISLFNENERRSWSSPSVIKYNIGAPSLTSTPNCHRTASQAPTQLDYSSKESPNASPQYTPTKSWQRITGINSPRASLKYQKNNTFATPTKELAHVQPEQEDANFEEQPRRKDHLRSHAIAAHGEAHATK